MGQAEALSERWMHQRGRAWVDNWRRLDACIRVQAAEVSARSAADELQEIAMARLRQEQNVQLATGHYDAMRMQVGRALLNTARLL